MSDEEKKIFAGEGNIHHYYYYHFIILIAFNVVQTLFEVQTFLLHSNQIAYGSGMLKGDDSERDMKAEKDSKHYILLITS